jgi:diacylglycerol kinase
LTPTNDEDESQPNRRGPSLLAAMLCYAVIALLAAFTLDGNFRLVVWIFLVGLAIRTYLATLRKP